MTAAEHRLAYRRYKANADELKVRIDLALVTGIDSHEHMDLVREYHDELMCAAKHFALAAAIEEATT